MLTVGSTVGALIYFKLKLNYLRISKEYYCLFSDIFNLVMRDQTRYNSYVDTVSLYFAFIEALSAFWNIASNAERPIHP